jgi:hAT family C-terminal dimerisation region
MYVLFHVVVFVTDLNGEECTDVLAFWQGMRDRVPQLAEIASRYLSIPVNSVDAERSFSVYNNVVSDKRHNLSDESTKMLVMMYFNSAVESAVN